MKVAITITARMKSERLPLKVVRYIKGKPMIEHQIDRLKLVKGADEIIMCTSVNPQDAILVDIAEKNNIKWFRGSEEDVLDRIYGAAKKHNVDFVVSITADNPLVDLVHMDKIITKFKETNADYITCKKLPIGAFSYGIKVKALAKVIELKKEKDTEVWGKLFEERKEFKKIDLEVEKELVHPEIRLTVDEEQDLELVRKIFDQFYVNRNDFALKDIIRYVSENPEIKEINKVIAQKKPRIEIVKIGNKLVGANQPCFIIAEAGVNHNGSLELARNLIDKAAEAGVDAVKFQIFKAEKVVTEKAGMAEYQKKNLGKKAEKQSQADMLRKLELGEKEHKELKAYAQKKGLLFSSTAHSGNDDVDALERVGVDFHKIGSGDLTNKPFVEYVAKTSRPVLLSTGMATMEEVKKATSWIREQGNDKLILLHCTTNYPCPFDEVNMRSMLTMMKEINVPIGYSDHTLGIEVPLLARALGACIVEKHFTLDKSMDGPDHKASLDPEELKQMVVSIRNLEKAMGSAEKKPNKSEEKMMLLVRKSLIAAREIKKGKKIEAADLIIKRPGIGMAPEQYDHVIGKKTKTNIAKDEMLKPADFE